MKRAYASLSLDLDNEWSYLKTRGDAAWEQHPSYLPAVVPRFLTVTSKLGLRITVFIVGFDADQPNSAPVLRSIAQAGHEIGNHSYHHEPWLHTYSIDEVEQEIVRSGDAIFRATGTRPAGFRGPGFSLSRVTLDTLARHGYEYDCSTFPTYIGPLARLYYFMTAKISKGEREQRDALFGNIADGLRPLRPYRWRLNDETLVEIPVTTFPIVRLPFHFSYILFIASKAGKMAALAYFTAALEACKLAGISPSLLLHPLDFLGAEDVPSLRFFPAMDMPAAVKADVLHAALRAVAKRFEVVTVREHAQRAAGSDQRSPVIPSFA